MITYIGNKRALLGQIGQVVEGVKGRLGKDRLRVFDVFSGSGIVSRYLKAHASTLISNDIEDYAAVVGRCYLRNRSTVDLRAVSEIVDEMNRRVEDDSLPRGFIEELYAPRDEGQITREDRVFYTRDNARRLDGYRQMIDTAPEDVRELLLGPLLSRASVHSNTAGVFKGFYKNRETKVGQFGGTGSDALVRIKGKIVLEPPVLSRFECDYEVLQEDANSAARRVGDLDLAYIDPPYNQHPYGSNYFMLNRRGGGSGYNCVRYERPEKISRVSGIPEGWSRNGRSRVEAVMPRRDVRARSLPLMRDLLH